MPRLLARTTCALGISTLALASMTLPRSAAAEPAAPGAAGIAPSPRELVARGDRLRRVHAYEEALTEYQGAQKVAPSPSTLRKIADVERELGHLDGAASAYEGVLASKDVGREDRKAAEAALKALSTGAATMVLRAPDGAAVTIDDRPVEVKSAGIRVTPGAHVVRVTKDGFEPFLEAVDVAAGATSTVDVALAPLSQDGALVVREKKGARMPVIIDGKAVGSTPYRTKLPAGDHIVEVSGQNVATVRATVGVVARQRSELVVEAITTVGVVNVRPVPANAKILVDGTAVTAPANGALELPQGTHTLVAKAAGYQDSATTLRVDPGTTASWAPRLEPIVNAPPPPDYLGGHFDVGLQGNVPVVGKFDPCAAAPAPPSSCSNGDPLGGGLLIAGGYNFGLVGVDVSVVPSFHIGSSELSYLGGDTLAPEAAVAHDQTIIIGDVGGVAAVGPSFATQGQVARFTASLGGGFAVRHIFVKRTMSGGILDQTSGEQTGFGPAGLARIGFLLGSTPGFKVQIGALGMLEALSVETQPLARTANNISYTVPPYAVLNGVQLYVGPELTMRFGY